MSVLPFSYIEGLFSTLKESPSVRFKTYQNLPFNFGKEVFNEESLRDVYQAEYLAWRESKKIDPTLDIILMHDCDSGPSETVQILDYETKHGIVSTTSVFARIRDKSGLKSYPIDFSQLVHSQKAGSCFTYHCNAWENTNFDESLLSDYVNTDVRLLIDSGLDIRFFSPHGGRPSPDGRNNNSFFYPQIFNKPLLWTHNRFAPSGKRYSDGGFMVRLLKGEMGTDLRNYLISCAVVPNRIFILLHPQYYFAEHPNLIASSFEKTPWISEYWKYHLSGCSKEYWRPLAQALQKLEKLI